MRSTVKASAMHTRHGACAASAGRRPDAFGQVVAELEISNERARDGCHEKGGEGDRAQGGRDEDVIQLGRQLGHTHARRESSGWVGVAAMAAGRRDGQAVISGW